MTVWEAEYSYQLTPRQFIVPVLGIEFWMESFPLIEVMSFG
jgi:hypothetical protein